LTKETILKEYLEKQINHFNNQYKKSDNIIDKLKSDLFKQVLGYLQRKGWDETYEWVKNQYSKFVESPRRLAYIMAGGYKQARDKMWSIARKENKG